MPKEIKPYKCTTCCRKAFRNPSDLVRHEKKGVKKHACPYAGCHSVYVQKIPLDDHIRLKHTGEKPRACPFCPARFCASYETNSHMLRDHRKLLWHCKSGDCKHGGSRNESEFKKHVNKHHDGENYNKLAIRPKKADLEFAAASYGTLLTPIADSDEPTPSPSSSPQPSSSNESTPPLTPSPASSPLPSLECSAVVASQNDNELTGLPTTGHSWVPAASQYPIFEPAPAPFVPMPLDDDFVKKMDWFMTAPEIQRCLEPTHFQALGFETSGFSFPPSMEEPFLSGSAPSSSNDFGSQFDTSFPMPAPLW